MWIRPKNSANAAEVKKPLVKTELERNAVIFQSIVTLLSSPPPFPTFFSHFVSLPLLDYARYTDYNKDCKAKAHGTVEKALAGIVKYDEWKKWVLVTVGTTTATTTTRKKNQQKTATKLCVNSFSGRKRRKFHISTQGADVAFQAVVF